MMISRAKVPSKRVFGRRNLFNKFKDAQKTISKIRESTSFHHEYSIRPDTFAFKVSGGDNKTTAVVATKTDSNDLTGGSGFYNKKYKPSGFNLMNYIYRNATNYPFQDQSPQEVFDRYPYISSNKLGKSMKRPKKVKMLASDFIEDSLYNPYYGYFSQEVEIFHQDKPFDYNNINDVDEFMDVWKQSYAKYENPQVEQVKKANMERAKEVEKKEKREKREKLKRKEQQKNKMVQTSTKTAGGVNFEGNGNKNLKEGLLAKTAKKIHNQEMSRTGNFAQTKSNYQLWHTPTELFSPFYGEALARYILTNYKLNHYPYHDLIIFEMGGGNGTLMCNILNYIKETSPELYSRTQYKIIEISSQLAQKQFQSAIESKLVSQGLDSSKVSIVNKSIFEWNSVVNDPCFFIALEVFDNFSHDVIRYDNTTGEPYQGYVLVDEHGDFYEFFTPELSHYANIYLQLRENSEFSMLKKSQTASGKLDTIKSLIPGGSKVHPLLQSSIKLHWKHSLYPFKDNLTPGEFIPTRLLQFFHILKHKFPNHQLVSSDFNYLPKTIPEYYNGPVVQTIIKDQMVDISTYMCLQGYFDIMFPTDFQLASAMYKMVTGRVARVESHREFLEEWADSEATTTKNGENPMLDFYSNVSFMVS